MKDSGTGAGIYKTRTIVRLTQFSAEVLRAWERRHGLLRPARSSGGHRLYTEEDLQVLLSVRRLLAEGWSIGEIARIGREGLRGETRTTGQAPEPVAPPPVDFGFSSEQAWPDAQRLVQTVIDRALAMDTEGINRSLDEALTAVSPEQFISDLITPSSVKIGDLWMAGHCSVANEHMASGIFSHRLRKMIEASEPSRSDWRPVIIACFPDEYHQLGALIAAYWLCRNGFRVSILGPALPFEDLKSAWETLDPSAIVLSVTRRAVYDLHHKDFRRLVRVLPERMLLYVGGQGVPPAEGAWPERPGVRIFRAGRPVPGAIPEMVTAIRERGRRSFSSSGSDRTASPSQSAVLSSPRASPSPNPRSQD